MLDFTAVVCFSFAFNNVLAFTLKFVSVCGIGQMYLSVQKAE